MLACCRSATTVGIDAFQVEVEVDLNHGLPRYFLVGLPDRAIHESRDRIESALRQCHQSFPRGRIIVNLAPVDLPKVGSSFDLPIAIGLLAADRKISTERLDQTLFAGELSLDGRLRPVKGVLSMAQLAKDRGHRWLVVPEANGAEASAVDGICVLPCPTLGSVLDWVNGRPLAALPHPPKESARGKQAESYPDFRDVAGQESVKRALEVAAAGGHNVLMVGPPGSGKTMMARRLPGILPPMSREEAVETTQIHSVAGRMPPGVSLLADRPFRSPHHTVTDVSLVGGSRIPIPGEISLANHGILFLDELPEFRRRTLDLLRQPMEDGYVEISRARYRVQYPSRVMLVASMNPSPQGGWPGGDQTGVTDAEMRKYLSRISGPLMDRIDMHVEVTAVEYEELKGGVGVESSTEIRSRVIQARQKQVLRFQGVPGIYCNAQMNRKELRAHTRRTPDAESRLGEAMKKNNLSARAYDRILKMARTVADLDGKDRISKSHIYEAIRYRVLDRSDWWSL
ncbi:MAG: YifB family Mg chelatase-like AAA ATPase [Balneolaceae bacterium]